MSIEYERSPPGNDRPPGAARRGVPGRRPRNVKEPVTPYSIRIGNASCNSRAGVLTADVAEQQTTK
eukprot:824186-Prorocentrum_minimum.AAC.1